MANMMRTVVLFSYTCRVFVKALMRVPQEFQETREHGFKIIGNSLGKKGK